MSRFQERKTDYKNAYTKLEEATSRKIYHNIKTKYIKEFKKLEEKFEQIL